jgi:hypothetical protein
MLDFTSTCGYGDCSIPNVLVPLKNRVVPAAFTAGRNTSLNNASHKILPSYGQTVSGATLVPVTALT